MEIKSATLRVMPRADRVPRWRIWPVFFGNYGNGGAFAVDFEGGETSPTDVSARGDRHETRRCQPETDLINLAVLRGLDSAHRELLAAHRPRLAAGCDP